MCYKKIAPFVICTLGSFFYVYDYFLAVSPSVMTGSLLSTFNLDAGALGSLLAVFFLASTFFQVPAGMLLDRFGARALLSLAVLVSGVGALLFGVAQAPWQIAFARLLMGIGSPFAFLGALFLASRWFAHKYFALIAGLVQVGASLGCIIGGGPMAALVNALGWRESMIGIGFVTLILSVLFWAVLRDGQPQVKVAVEYHDQRLRDVFKIKAVWWIALVGFASWITVTGVGALWGVPYLMGVYNLSNEATGYLYVLLWLGLGIGSPLVGWWSDRMKQRKLPFYFCFSVGIIAGLLFMMAPRLPLWVVAILLFVLGFAASLQSLTFGVAKDLIPHKHFVAASGLINLAAVFTGVVSQPLMGYIIDGHAQARGVTTHIYSVQDYQLGFIVIPLVLFLGLLITWRCLPETHCVPVYEHHD
jgi:MFS family permease